MVETRAEVVMGEDDIDIVVGVVEIRACVELAAALAVALSVDGSEIVVLVTVTASGMFTIEDPSVSVEVGVS